MNTHILNNAIEWSGFCFTLIQQICTPPSRSPHYMLVTTLFFKASKHIPPRGNRNYIVSNGCVLQVTYILIVTIQLWAFALANMREFTYCLRLCEIKWWACTLSKMKQHHTSTLFSMALQIWSNFLEEFGMFWKDISCFHVPKGFESAQTFNGDNPECKSLSKNLQPSS